MNAASILPKIQKLPNIPGVTKKIVKDVKNAIDELNGITD